MIVAPLSILGVWEEEFQKFAAFPYALAVLSGSSAKKLDTLRHMIGTALQVVVVNYESAWRLEKALTAWHPDLIIADEGHKIKTHNIAASKAMHRMGREASYRLLLTGTVITNKAIDVFSQYKFLNPAIYGNSFYPALCYGLHRQGIFHRHYGAGRLYCYWLGGPSQRNPVDAGRLRRQIWRRNLLDFQKRF